MSERGEIVRYAYWSDRRVKSICQDNGIKLDARIKTKFTVFKIPLTSTSLDLEREPRTLYRKDIATLLERAIGDLAVEDFVTPPPIRFAKGVGLVEFSHFISTEPNRVVLYTTVQASDGTRIIVCLFGSKDNVAGYTGVGDPQVGGWTSSAMWSIKEWLASRCTVSDIHGEDAESLSVEAMKIATLQGNNDGLREHPDQPWQRGFTFGDASESEWMAEIYSDVVLDKDRWSLREPFDRVLVGAPLWVRTPTAGLRRYRDLRKRFNQQELA